MNSSNKTCTNRRAPYRQKQRGVVLIFSLIALSIMLVGAVALVSSFNTTLVAAGNIGFKRDLQNQSERAVAKVFKEFATGGALATPTLRASTLETQNYSAVALASNPQGIPLILLAKDSDFVAANTGADLTASGEIKIRYVVDRLCAAAANGVRAQAAAAGLCLKGDDSGPYGMDEYHVQGDSANLADSRRLISNGSGGTQASGIDGLKKPVLYRISMRVKGPRNTESYFQTTFSEPLP